jgi:protein-S-isoprenylcysteine O-methyltransferase Ste14
MRSCDLWGRGRGSALALIQAAPLDIKARREERWLREKFPDYDEYVVKVRRLIPWLY